MSQRTLFDNVTPPVQAAGGVAAPHAAPALERALARGNAETPERVDVERCAAVLRRYYGDEAARVARRILEALEVEP